MDKPIKSPLRFLLVRHGQSEANVERSRDIPDESVQLTERGFAQADACGAFLANYLADQPVPGGTTLYTSSYLRARQTAQRIYDAINPGIEKLRVQESDFLIEQHHGYLDGYEDEQKAELFPELMAREALHWKHGSKQFAPMHGGEMRVMVAHRVATFLDAVFREHTDPGASTIIIVSHGITMRQIAKHLLKMPREVSDREPNPFNCDVRLLQRHGEGNRQFSDFGAIWHQGAAQQVEPVPHPRTRDLMAAGAFRAFRPRLPSGRPA